MALFKFAMDQRTATATGFATQTTFVDVHLAGVALIVPLSLCVQTTALRTVFAEHTHASATMDTQGEIVLLPCFAPTTAMAMESAIVGDVFATLGLMEWTVL